MKIPVILLVLLISFSCSSRNFDWLCGNWVRTNDEEGYRTYENWMKNSNTEYIGLGCTLQDGDTVLKRIANQEQRSSKILFLFQLSVVFANHGSSDDACFIH